ncbi:MAG: elongation factor G [Mariniblastus sp.]
MTTLKQKTSIQRIRNIGISAHIDSGKTTLTERMLFYCGRIHKLREVRGGDGGATMDSDPIERQRGITIMSAVTSVDWNQHTLNVIDTPGHVDFTVEVERSLRVLDGAVLVLCSVGGVQSQSLTVDRQMRRYRVPRIAFINKMDRTGANYRRVIAQMRERLNTNAVAIQIPIGNEASFQGVVDLVTMEAVYFDGEFGQERRRDEIPDSLQQTVMNARKELVEALAILDDSIMELVLSGEQPTANEMKRVIRAGTLAHQLTPVLMGSAYKNKGIQEVLDAATMYLPSPEEREVVANDNSKQKPNSNADPANDHVDKIQLSCESDEPAVAMAFKTVVEKFGQLTYLRVYQGQIEKGRSYVNARTQKSVRFGRLVRVHADQREEIERAMPGDIVGVIGVDCASGDTFTDSGCNLSLENITVAQPVLQLSIAPEKREDAAKLGKALDRFRKEDPTFQVTSDPKTGETLIAGMGQLHLDVYVQRIKDDYDCKCVVGQPRVAYKERPTATVEFEHTLKKMTGGPGQFAHIVGRLEVLAENSEVGFEFEDEIVGGRIERKFVSAVRAGVMESLERGPLGRFEVVEVKFTLIDGKQHEQDSSEIAFRQCAAEAMRNIVLPKSKIALLEPIMKLEIEVPSEFQGAVTGHLGRKRGLVTSSEVADGVCVIVAECPLAELFDYANSLRSMTQGNGNFSMEPCGYREVPKNVQDEVLADLEL